MSEFTKTLVNLGLDDKLQTLRQEYRKNGIPTILDESFCSLLLSVSVKQPKRILEIGTATGCSGIGMLSISTAELTTVEVDEYAFNEAKKNFSDFGLSNRVTQLFGDSLEVLKDLHGDYDFVFMDGSKSKYIDCLSLIEPHLTDNAVIFSDNVLFRGYIDGSRKCPHKYNTIRRKMTEYLDYMVNGGKYRTVVYDVGDGISISYYKGEKQSE